MHACKTAVASEESRSVNTHFDEMNEMLIPSGSRSEICLDGVNFPSGNVSRSPIGFLVVESLQDFNRSEFHYDLAWGRLTIPGL